MSWRKAALWWACFAALSSYYLGVLRQAPRRVAEQHVQAALVDVAVDSIVRVELRRAESVIRLRRAGASWEVTEPSGGAVADDLVTALVAALADSPSVEAIAEAPKGLAEYGLDPPASEIVLGTEAQRDLRVRVGARNPAGTAVYAQCTDSPRVVLIGLNVRYYEDLLFESLRSIPGSG